MDGQYRLSVNAKSSLLPDLGLAYGINASYGVLMRFRAGSSGKSS